MKKSPKRTRTTSPTRVKATRPEVKRKRTVAKPAKRPTLSPAPSRRPVRRALAPTLTPPKARSARKAPGGRGSSPSRKVATSSPAKRKTSTPTPTPIKRATSAPTKRKTPTPAKKPPRSAVARKAPAPIQRKPPEPWNKRPVLPRAKKLSQTAQAKAARARRAAEALAAQVAEKLAQRKRAAPQKAAPLSQTPAAVAARKRRAAERATLERRNALARKRRAEKKGIAQQLEIEAQQKLEARRAKRIAKKTRAPVDERALALGWLEEIRNSVAELFPASLEVTAAEAGAGTPWLVVGRIDLLEAVSYADFAESLGRLQDDLLLEAQINPQRLSQIRVVYHDPKSKRGEGDSIVSKAGAWEFVLGDLIGEITGGGPDDEGSLAVRYEATTIATFYIYFSTEVTRYSVMPWQPATQTIQLKK